MDGNSKLQARFAPAKAVHDSKLTAATVGLVTREEFSKKRKEVESFEERAADEATEKQRQKKKKKQKQALSFADPDDDDDGGGGGGGDAAAAAELSVKRYGAERAQKEAQEAKTLRLLEEQYEAEKQRVLAEVIEVAYTVYPDRKQYAMTVKKGDTVGHFLQKSAFQNKELAKTQDALFVREDLILPNDMTFYDVLAAGAKGRTGRLCEFNTIVDTGGRRKTTAIVCAKWYSRNKEMMPARLWELFDLSKDYQRSWKDGQVGDWTCKCGSLNWGSKNPKKCVKCGGDRPVFSSPLV
ncbi:Protein XAP5 CIRCADIAN TIMEKEEPER [Diplonema papillatum]|nr:Protein XAP5 CIRCADIAN TIMEKEEPER [Diplonema papillatum]